MQVYFNTPTIEYIREEIARMKLEKTRMLNQYPEESRFVQNIQKSIDDAQKQLEEEQKRLLEQSAIALTDTQVEENNLPPSLLYKATKTELNEVNAQMNSLINDKKNIENQLAQLSKHETTINRYTREIREMESALERYQSNLLRSEILSALKQSQVTNLQVVQPADLPIEPNQASKNRYLNIALAIYASIFGSIAFVLFSFFISPTVLSADQLEESLDIPVLCSFKKGELK